MAFNLSLMHGGRTRQPLISDANAVANLAVRKHHVDGAIIDLARLCPTYVVTDEIASVQG